jgi:hypothetical protein
VATYSDVEISKHATLTPDTVDTVTFTTDLSYVEVINRNGAGELFVLIDSDSTDPAVEGDGTIAIPAALGAGIVELSRARGETQVKLVSAEAVAYSVRVVEDPL